MKIVLLFGGRSAEHEVSVRSASYVYQRLCALGHEVFPVEIAKNGVLFLHGGAPAEDPKAPVTLSSDGTRLSFADSIRPDLVFSVVHGKDGEDGAWQGLFTLTDTPFVGAGVCPSALGMNKRLSKVLAAACGVPTVPYLSVKRYTADLPARLSHRLSYPLFVKPVSGGSSVGVSRVEKEGELKAAVMLALSEDEEALIEEAVDGSELEVAILERDGQLLISPRARSARTPPSMTTTPNTAKKRPNFSCPPHFPFGKPPMSSSLPPLYSVRSVAVIMQG